MNASVARANAKQLAARAQAPLYAAAIVFRAGARDLDLAANGSIARVRVELGVEVRGQVERDAAVARGDRPVVLHGRSWLGAERDRSIAGVQLHGLKFSGNGDAAVARLELEVAFRAVERHRAVAGVQHEAPRDVVRANAAVARAQIERPMDVLDPNRPV